VHIPDGFLDAKTFVTLDVVGAAFVAAAAARARRRLRERAVPFMAVLAAFIFAAQMLNFPVAGGTSGHFTGGALAAILLGPAPAVLVMALVLVIQALAFGDGGVLTLGANILNMAVVAPFVGWGVYFVLRKILRFGGGKSVAAFAAAWLAVVAAASACAWELAVAGTVPLKVVWPAMAAVHALIGIGEGLITAGALALARGSKAEVLGLGVGGTGR